jgi:hypothetical protein
MVKQRIKRMGHLKTQEMRNANKILAGKSVGKDKTQV